MPTPVDQMAYGVAQAARVGWYFGQYLLAARLTGPTKPRPRVTLPMPDRAEFLSGLRALMARDWSNIRAGYYKLPHDLFEHPGRMIGNARAFLAEVPRVDARRRKHGHAEVFHEPPQGTGKLPRYYLQNFHFQTDGYLSDRSARLYDHQVEVLFGGGADAMRRQALVPVHHFLVGRDAGRTRLLDVACGTGQFLTFLRDSHPRLSVAGVDLSLPYLAEARRRLSRWPGTGLAQASIEALPTADGSIDLVTCIFLFHELPRKIRARAAREIARVLRPGGQLIFLDSLQFGDRPSCDGLLEYFPQAFHEPYYADYTRQNLIELFEDAGLTHGATDLVFLSKLLVFEKGGSAV
ncbi:MAG TPA: class I SAM-dependent methyltransferase [Alphaproteobacteria bacterium]|nr:class I SAM-dependent methyltransferase [Alphaproteobacteria bacterium]